MEIQAHGPQKTVRVRWSKKVDEPGPSVELVILLQKLVAPLVLAYKMLQFVHYPR